MVRFCCTEKGGLDFGSPPEDDPASAFHDAPNNPDNSESTSRDVIDPRARGRPIDIVTEADIERKRALARLFNDVK